MSRRVFGNHTERSEAMVEDWLALIGNMNGAVRDLRQAAPEVMKTFSEMARAAHSGEALDAKTKELERFPFILVHSLSFGRSLCIRLG
jgi:hypothetical protein